MIDQTLKTIRSEVASKGWTLAELASKAGVSWATVRDIGSDDWSPSVKTLRKIERAIGGLPPVKPTPRPRRAAGANEHRESAP